MDDCCGFRKATNGIFFFFRLNMEISVALRNPQLDYPLLPTLKGESHTLNMLCFIWMIFMALGKLRMLSHYIWIFSLCVWLHFSPILHAMHMCH